jgi:hypothetical protein
VISSSTLHYLWWAIRNSNRSLTVLKLLGLIFIIFVIIITVRSDGAKLTGGGANIRGAGAQLRWGRSALLSPLVSQCSSQYGRELHTYFTTKYPSKLACSPTSSYILITSDYRHAYTKFCKSQSLVYIFRKVVIHVHTV